jgi:hypothetical protein
VAMAGVRVDLDPFGVQDMKDSVAEISVQAPPEEAKSNGAAAPSKKKVNYPDNATNPLGLSPNGSPKEYSPIRVKASSTSTLFISDTITKPDVEDVLKCMAKHLLAIITKGASTCEKTYYDIFNEMVHPITKSDVNFFKLPTEGAVFGYLKFIYVFERMDPECIIMCLTYIDRLVAYSKITIDVSNWRRIVLASWIVALKTWEELAVYNLDFLGCFDGKVTVQDLNMLEMHFLNLIQYNVFLSSSAYTKMYFDLKAYSTISEERFPLKPLSNERGNLLERRSQHSSQELVKKIKKSVSVDMLKPITCFVPAVIN